jgi:hypothetical protein
MTNVAISEKQVEEANTSPLDPGMNEIADVEGLDTDVDPDIGRKEYPIDSVLIRPENRTVFEIMRRIKGEKFILDPDFQRDFVWDETKQSRLIESVLMRIPLPVFYLAEQSDGKVVVVDGLQRLTTFSRFINNQLTLKNTDAEEVLDGNRFSDLPFKLQARIEDTSLTLFLIDSKVPERIRLDIFERVNSGVALTRQQMRNSLYSGPATRWLKAQAKHPDFLQATRKGLDPKKMRDREVINRFCAFHLLGVQAYKGDMDEFLAEALKHMNRLPDATLDKLAADFQRSMRHNYALSGDNTFRKILASGRRSVINVSLFDVLSVFMVRYSEDIHQDKQNALRPALTQLFDDEEFTNAITISTNSIKRVQKRFEIVETRLGKVLK